MKIFYWISIIVVIPFILLGCTPSENAIATAISQTETARMALLPEITDTSLPPTKIIIPPTDTPEPTSTLLPSPTPDVRVFDIDPKKLMLSKEDLPPEGKYYLPGPEWISPHRNSEIVSQMGTQEGKEYLQRTERVDGWFVYYNRGSLTEITPEQIYDNVVLYGNSHGASLVVTEYGTCVDPTSDFLLIDMEETIGDVSNMCKLREMQASGENRVWIMIEFSYRNIFHKIAGYGWEHEVNEYHVIQLANIALNKIIQHDLSTRVTFEP